MPLKIKYQQTPSLKAAVAHLDVLASMAITAAWNHEKAKQTLESLRAEGARASSIQIAEHRAAACMKFWDNVLVDLAEAQRTAAVISRASAARRETFITLSLAKTVKLVLNPKWQLPLPVIPGSVFEPQDAMGVNVDPLNSHLTTVSWHGALASVLVLRVAHAPDKDHPVMWTTNDLYIAEDRKYTKVRSPTAAFREVRRILKEQLDGPETTKPRRRKS